MKNIFMFIGVLVIVMATFGCTNPIDKIDEMQMNKISLTEIINDDYTYTYKSKDGEIIFEKLELPLTFNNNIAVLSKNGKYGLANKLGDYIVEPIYDYIGKYSDGMYAFIFRDISNNGVKIGYFNEKGEVAIEPRSTDIILNSGYCYDYNFHNGVAMYRDPKTHKYGYIDKNGKLIIDIKYDWAEAFNGKLAPVTQGNNYGYINTLGELVIPYKFVYAEKFSDGLAAVFNGKTWGYINENGKYVISSKYGSFEGHDGEEVANPFIDGVAAVYLGQGQAYRYEVYKGKFALIDKTGQILNQQKYDSLELIYYEPKKPNYRATLNGTTLILDTKGNVIREEKY